MATERTFKTNYYREKRKRKKLEKVLKIVKTFFTYSSLHQYELKDACEEGWITESELNILKEHLFDGKKLL